MVSGLDGKRIQGDADTNKSSEPCVNGKKKVWTNSMLGGLVDELPTMPMPTVNTFILVDCKSSDDQRGRGWR